MEQVVSGCGTVGGVGSLLLVVCTLASVNAHPLGIACTRNTGLTAFSSAATYSAPSIKRGGDDDNNNNDGAGGRETLGNHPGIERPKNSNRFNGGGDDVNSAERSESDTRQVRLESPTRYKQLLLDVIERSDVHPINVPVGKTIRSPPLMMSGYRAVRAADDGSDEVNGPPTISTWRRQRWWCPDDDDIIARVGSQPEVGYELMDTGSDGDTNVKRSSLSTSSRCKQINRPSSALSVRTTRWSKRPRLRYYRDGEGPKRNWRTNMMRVWGKRSLQGFSNGRYSNALKSTEQLL